MTQSEHRGMLASVLKVIRAVLLFIVKVFIIVLRFFWDLFMRLFGRSKSKQDASNEKEPVVIDVKVEEEAMDDIPASEIPESPQPKTPQQEEPQAKKKRFPKPILAVLAIVLIAAAAFSFAKSNATSNSTSSTAVATAENTSTAGNEAAEAKLCFSDVKYDITLEEDEKTHIVQPVLEMTAIVTNNSSSVIRYFDLPSLVYGKESVRFEIVGDPLGYLESNQRCKVAVELKFGKDAKTYTFEIKQAEGIGCAGLDDIADKLTEDFAATVKKMPAEQEKVDARISNEQNMPFVFSNVTWRVDNEAVAAENGNLKTVIEIKADVTNESSVSHKAEDLPVLSFDGGSIAFTSSDIESNKTVEAKIYRTFDENAASYKFEFVAYADKPSFKGLDGVAEKITAAFAEKHASLKQEREAIEADRQAQAEAERQQQEQEARERAAQEEAERQRLEQEAQAQAEAERQQQEQNAANNAQSRTVWVLGDNDTYHTNPNCWHIRNRGATAMTLAEAVERGCSACGHCR